MKSFSANDQTYLHTICFRAATDAAYRAQLKANPAAVLGQGGIVIPPGTTVMVLEFDPTQRVVLLPPLLTDGVTVDIKNQRITPVLIAQGGA